MSKGVFRRWRRRPAPDPDCRSGENGCLVWTETTVARGVALLERDAAGILTVVHLVAEIGLARCSLCRKRFRVLPAEVLPRKTYSLPVIEHEVSAYGTGTQSLRQVAWGQPGERVPSHTTLHGWTEGLGAYVLGRRVGELPGQAPMSRLWVETESRQPEVAATRRAAPLVDPRRYRSEERHDRLSAVAVLLQTAPLVSRVSAPQLLTAWRSLALLWTRSSLLVFRSQISCTAIERGDRSAGRRSGSSTKRSRDPWPTPTRSPPGDSNR